MDDKQAAIISQVAAKIASDLTAVSVGTGQGTIADYFKLADDVASHLFSLVSQHTPATPVRPVAQPGTPAYATQVVQNAFPGAQQVSGVPSQSAPQQGMDRDAMWADVINNPDNWYNNMTDAQAAINGGNRPDFRHKTMLNSRGNKVGLYLVDKRYGKHAPKFVFDHFGIPYPAQAVPAQPAQVVQMPQVQQQPIAQAPQYPDTF